MIINTVSGSDDSKGSLENIAYVEDTNIASRNYTTTDFIFYNGIYYKVTNAISANQTIIVGTNVEQTKVSNHLYDSIIEQKVLAVSGWSNGVYNLASIYPNNKWDIQVTPCISTTSAQLKAWSIARPIGNVTANTITCLGTVPTIDITVMVIATKKGAS